VLVVAAVHVTITIYRHTSCNCNGIRVRLTLSIWPVKCQVSIAARMLFNVNAYGGTVLSLPGECTVNGTTLSCPSAEGQHHLGMGI